MTDINRSARESLSITLPESVPGQPGGEASFSVSMTDSSGRDRHLLVRVVGSLSGAIPATHILLPAHRTRSVPLALPVPHGLSAGDHRFLVEVVDRDTGSVVGSAESIISTLDTRSVSVHVSPPSITRRRRGRIRVIVRNHDDVSHRIRFRTEPDEEITRVTLKRDDIDIRAGEMVRIKGRVKVRPFFMGKNRERWYSVIGEGAGLPVYSRGNVRQKALVGQNIRSLMGLMCIVLVWAGMTLAIVRAVSPVTSDVTASAQEGDGGDGGTSNPDDGSSGGGEIPTPIDVTGTVTATPDGSGVVVTWRPVSIGDVGGDGKATPSTPSSDPNVTAQQTVTDEKGNFAVTGLDGLGLYQFTFSKQGHSTQSVIVQPEGESVALEIALTAGDGVVSGTTVDANGQPLGGITLSLTDGVITYTTTTPSEGDDKGQFAFSNLSTPATYILDANGAGLGLASTTFTLDSGASNTGIVMTLYADRTALSGSIATVLFMNQKRVIQSATGSTGDSTALTPAVTITATDGVVTRSTTSLTQGELAGTFRLEELPVNRTYTVTYSANYFTTFTEIIDLSVDTPARSISLTRSTGRLVGLVSITGSDVEPTSVAVTISSPDVTYKSTDSVSSSGSLLFDGIEPGRYTVVFEALGLDDQVVEAVFTAGVETRVNVTLPGVSTPTNTSSLTYNVKKAADTSASTVRVEVLHRADDDCGSVATLAPVQPCTYELAFAAGDSQKTITITGLAAGAYVISFSSTGYSETTRTAQLAIGQQAEAADVELSPLGTLSGQVTDDTGSAVQGLAVNLTRDNRVIATSTTNEIGEYKFDKLLSSTDYTVSTAGSAFNTVSRSVAGAIGATINVDISVRALSLIIGDLKYYDVLTGKDLSVEPNNFNVFFREQPGTTTGRVTIAPILADGTSVPGLTVTDVANASATCTLGATDRGCTISGLSNAVHTFRVSGNGYNDSFVSAFPRNSVGLEIPAVVRPVASSTPPMVNVRVVNAVTGQPVAGASVTLSDQSAFCTSATDLSGLCSVTSLNPGTYTIATAPTDYLAHSASITVGSSPTALTLALYPTWVDASQVGLVKSLGAYRLAVAPLPSPGYDVCIAVTDGSLTGTIPYVDTCVAAVGNSNPPIGMTAKVVSGISILNAETATRSVFISPAPGSISGIATVDNVAKANIKVEATRINKDGRIFETLTTFTNAQGAFSFTAVTPTSSGVRPPNPPACDLNSNSGTHTCWYVRASVDGLGVSNWTDKFDVFSDADSPTPSSPNIATSTVTLTLAFINDVGQPVSGLAVTIRRSDNSGVPTTVSTNTDGIVEFADLLASKWNVSTASDDYRTFNQDFTLSAGADTSDTVKLNSTKGTVKFVVTNSGAPLNGAVISEGTTVICTTADEGGVSGVCTSEPLPIGLHNFSVDANQPGVSGTSVSVSVLGSQTVVANALLGSTAGGLTVGVFDTAGNPVQGVTATITADGGGIYQCATTTNAQGLCSVGSLPLGTVSILATKSGYQDMRGTVTISSGGGSITLTAVSSAAVGVFVVEDEFNQPVVDALVTVDVNGTARTCTTNSNGVCQVVSPSPGQHPTTVTATGYVSASLNGSFVTASLSINRVTLRVAASAIVGSVTSSGSGVAGAVVFATGPNGRTASTTADANGDFVFPNLVAGTWSLRASANGHSTGIDTAVSVPSATPVTLALTRLNGTVRFVVLNRSSHVSGAVITESPGVTCTTDAFGTCTISNLTPGAHRFTVSSSGLVEATSTIEITGAQTVTATVILGPNNGTLHASVHDVAGNAVNNAQVVATPSSGSPASCTTTSGRCSIAGLATGVATVSVTVAGFTTMNGSVLITESGAAIAFVAFNSTGSVSFHMVDEAGANIAGTTISFHDGTNRSCTTAITSGTCTVSEVVPSTFTATAVTARYETASFQVHVTAGSHDGYRLILVPKRSGLSGVVKDELAQPVKGALVIASGPDGRSATTLTDNVGAYSFTGLPNGSWSVLASANGYVTGAAVTATVQDGTTPTADITIISRHGSVTLTLRTPAGGPATGLEATASSGGTVVATRTADANGNVTFGTDVLTYGQYTIHISDTATTPRYQAQTFVVNVDRGATLTLSAYLATRLGSVFVSVVGVPASGMGPATPLHVHVGLRDSSNNVTTVATSVVGTQRVAEFFDVPPGNYSLLVDAIGSSTYTDTSIVVPSSPGTTYNVPPHSSVTVPTAGSVNAGVITLVVAPVSTFITVKGIPYSDPSAFSPTTVSGSPTTLSVVPGARVELVGGHLRTPASAVSNGSGVAELGLVPPGTYAISITHQGSYDYNGTITITDKSVSDPFTKHINVNDQSLLGSLQAIVTADGDPSRHLSGATVSVVNSGITCITDSAGKCVLPDLSAGAHSIRVSHPLYNGIESASATVTAGITTPVSIGLGSTTGSVGVEVIDASTGARISGATVRLLSDTSKTCTTSASGACTVSTLPLGSAVLEIVKTNFDTAFVGTNVSSGQIASVPVSLTPAAATTGMATVHVRDASTGSVLSGAAVALTAGGAFCSAVTDANGSCTAASLTQGAYNITASKSGYESATTSINHTASGTSATINLVPSTGSITFAPHTVGNVAITDATVTKVGDGTVTCTPPNGQATCTISNLSRTPHTFKLVAAGHTDTFVTATPGTSNTTLHIVMSTTPSTTGMATVHVRDASTGSVLSGAAVALTAGGAFCSAVTDANGSCTAASLTQGAYNITASKSGYESATTSINHTASGTSATINLVPSTGSITFAPHTVGNVAITDATVTKVGDGTVTCTPPNGQATCTISNLSRTPHTFKLVAAGHTDTFVTATPGTSNTTLHIVMSTTPSTTGTLNVTSVKATNTSTTAETSVAITGPASATCTITVASANCSHSLAEGTYTLSFTSSAYETFNATVTVRGGVTTSVVAVMHDSVMRLAVTVIDIRTLKPIEGAGVSIGNGAPSQTDANGHVTDLAIQSGPNAVHVTKTGHIAATAHVNGSKGYSGSIVIYMIPSGEVQVTLSPGPSGDTTVSIGGHSGTCTVSGTATTLASAQCTARILHVPYGSWLVHADTYGSKTITVNSPLTEVTLVK